MQKTAYEMRISDWSSDVCSVDLLLLDGAVAIERWSRFAPRGQTPSAVYPVEPCARPAIRRVAAARRAARSALSPVAGPEAEIGSASCRAGVCQYVSI